MELGARAGPSVRCQRGHPLGQGNWVCGSEPLGLEEAKSCPAGRAEDIIKKAFEVLSSSELAQAWDFAGMLCGFPAGEGTARAVTWSCLVGCEG